MDKEVGIMKKGWTHIRVRKETREMLRAEKKWSETDDILIRRLWEAHGKSQASKELKRKRLETFKRNEMIRQEADEKREAERMARIHSWAFG